MHDYTTKLWTDFLLIELISCVMLPPENVFKSKSSGADSALASTKARLAARKSQEEDEKKKTMKNTGRGDGAAGKRIRKDVYE